MALPGRPPLVPREAPAEMSPNATQGAATVLKAAAMSTLKPGSADNTSFGDAKTLKPVGVAPAKSAGGAAYPAENNATMKKKVEEPKSKLRTVWEPEEKPTQHARKLSSLAGKVDKMAGVFEAGAQGRSQQRAEMEALHNDQLAQLDKVSAAVDAQMTELAQVLDKFETRFRGNLESSFQTHHNNLHSRVAALAPKMEALDARNAALRAALDEERASRIHDNVAILNPVKEHIARIELELAKERRIRENRDADITRQMRQAVDHLNGNCKIEEENRKRKHEDTVTEWQREHARLERRQQDVEKVCKHVIADMAQEVAQEMEARKTAQDPIVVALTQFIHAFQKDVKEKAEMGG